MLRKITRSITEINFRKPGVLFIVFTSCFAFWFVDLWRPYNVEKKETQFVWDVMNYYSYLPAKFCNNNNFDLHKDHTTLFLPYGPKGTFVPKTTYGMALLYSPMFALGYKIAYNQQDPLDGFSEAFSTVLHWGSILYVILGLVFLRKFLNCFFNETVTAITLFGVLFSTMLFFYTFAWSEMAHGYLFTLFSLFLLLTHRWHQGPTVFKTIGVGLTLGLICLIRPTEIYILFFFVFWNVRTWAELKLKVKYFLSMWKHLLLIALICVLYWIPQFLFWKEHAGTYFYFSYPGEKFFWNDPQILNILFSYRKGWFTYTPFIALAFIGFFFVKKDFPLSKWTLAGVTALIIYVLSCWWDWFFGGSFGARAFCQSIAFLSIPIASFIEFVFYSPRKIRVGGLLRLVTVVFIFSCAFHTMTQTYLFNRQRIHHDSMTKKIYWDVFRKFQYAESYNYWDDVDVPDYEEMRRGNRDQ